MKFNELPLGKLCSAPTMDEQFYRVVSDEISDFRPLDYIVFLPNEGTVCPIQTLIDPIDRDDYYVVEDTADNLYFRVEYDLNYHGGDYSDVGCSVFLPYHMLSVIQSKMKGCDTHDAVKELFQLKTGYDPIHIIHYAIDDFYDSHGLPIS